MSTNTDYGPAYAGLDFAGGLYANEVTASSARDMMKFQERVARNAHQWEAEDLEKAGLNRILSVTGKGASASGGASFQAKNPVPSAEKLLLSAQLDQIRASTAKTIAETSLVDAQKPKAGFFSELWGDAHRELGDWKDAFSREGLVRRWNTRRKHRVPTKHTDPAGNKYYLRDDPPPINWNIRKKKKDGTYDYY